MRSAHFFALAAALGLFSAACGYKPLATNEATPTPQVRVQSEDPENSPRMGTPNDAPTLKPVMLAYLAAIKKHDEKALRKLMAIHFTLSMESAAKEAKLKMPLWRLMEMFETMDKPAEIRNEVFQGGRAAAQVRFGTEDHWSWRPFTMEDDEWKVTDESLMIMR